MLVFQKCQSFSVQLDFCIKKWESIWLNLTHLEAYSFWNSRIWSNEVSSIMPTLLKINVILVAEFEKEINSLLRKMESRKVRGVKVVGEKKKSLSATCLEGRLKSLNAWSITNALFSQPGEGGGAMESKLLCVDMAFFNSC